MKKLRGDGDDGDDEIPAMVLTIRLLTLRFFFLLPTAMTDCQSPRRRDDVPGAEARLKIRDYLY